MYKHRQSQLRIFILYNRKFILQHVSAEMGLRQLINNIKIS